MSSYQVGVLTISDRCSRGQAEDKSGPKLIEMVTNELGSSWTVTQRGIVPDEKDQIKSTLINWSDQLNLALILTTGGTGFAPRDVTPEATKEVLERETPGLDHAMMSGSLKVTPMAMLSRLTSGIRGKTLIINLPGNTKGAAENFSFVIPALKHGIDVLLDNKKKVEDHHNKGHVCPHAKNHDLVTDVASRPRKSPFPMISVDEAQKMVMEHCKIITLGTEVVDLNGALHRVLAEDVKAKDPLPPFPASIKDGYAVIASDGSGLRHVIGASNAGNEPEGQGILQKGQCVRINTGGPVPPGADAVVQVEDTELTKKSEDGKEEVEIKILSEPVKGQDIRPIGSDIEAGSVILQKGAILGPAEIGLLATVGAVKINVLKRPTVALLSTGNELQEPDDDQLKPGFIRDSNKSTLKALIDGEQGFSTFDAGIASDDLVELKTKLALALDHGDLIVTTGGVSMGDRDLLRQVLVQDFEATIHFGRVHMKPGKPTTFATLQWNGKTKLVLGLPGNPVSATVTSHLYVLPACRALSGYTRPFSAKVKARLGQNMRLDPRPEYLRVILSWDVQDGIANVESTGNQISSRLASLRAANGLLLLPPKSDETFEAKKGQIFDALVIGRLFH